MLLRVLLADARTRFEIATNTRTKFRVVRQHGIVGDDARQSQAPRQGFDLEPAVLQSLGCESTATSPPPLATVPTPRIVLPRPHANASSTRTAAMMSYPAHGKMPPRSVRSTAARTPMLAIFPATPRPGRSYLQSDSIPRTAQDGL